MDNITKYNPGAFCWVELSTSDTEKVKPFYRELFGWEETILSGDSDNRYTIFKIDGREIGAMYQSDSDEVSQWLPYVCVDSVDEVLNRTETAGGIVQTGSVDVTSAGRLAVIKAPEGELLGVLQGKEQVGTKIKGVPGSFCWNDLGVDDYKVSGKFYSATIGWELLGIDEPDTECITLKAGDEYVAGLYKRPEAMSALPRQWFTYFVVDDCCCSCKVVVENGGKVIIPVEEAEGMGAYALVSDPQGALFWIIKPA